MKSPRRRLLTSLALASAWAALPGLAQAQKPARIGLLMVRARPADFEKDIYAEIPREMRALGYVEGKNVHYEWRFGDGKPESLNSMAAELVKLNVDIIVASSNPATIAAKRATDTIPIVMATGGDPVASGFVKSLSRPGGNITGLSNLSGDLASKHFDLLRAASSNISPAFSLRVSVSAACAATVLAAVGVGLISERRLSIKDLF